MSYKAEFRSILKGIKSTKWSLRVTLAEFIATTFFVFIGCGTAVMFSTINVSNFASGAAAIVAPPTLNQTIISLANDLKINASFGINTSLAFGLGITVLIYALGHISAQINPAVTLALLLNGSIGYVQALSNMIAQLCGSVLGAGILYGMVPNAETSSLAANMLANGISQKEALLGEIVMTCLLSFTVLQTAEQTKNKDTTGNTAATAVGLAIFLGHCVLIPIDGCSINPARSFGPALVANSWADGRFWIFVVGPIAGALIAVPIYWLLSIDWEGKEELIGNDKRSKSAADMNISLS